MSIFARLLGRETPESGAAALYRAAVEVARRPHWYEAGAVPDTINGRFDMVATVVAVVLLRLETEPEAAETSARLTECFVTDMESQLREIGLGDVGIGKEMGRLVGALGGRLGALRDGAAAGSIREALLRNVYRGQAPSAEALDHVEGALGSFARDLASTPLDALLGGRLPA